MCPGDDAPPCFFGEGVARPPPAQWREDGLPKMEVERRHELGCLFPVPCAFFSACWDSLCSSHASFFTSRPVFGSQVLVSGSWPLLPNPVHTFQMHR